jgi:hypothetical protein
MANGIPSLLGQVTSVVNDVTLVVADAANVLAMFGFPQWGIFNDDGSLALQPDSIISVDFKRDWKLPNYPQEEGAFESYNKVTMPFDARMRMTKGGTDAERSAFLDAVDSAADSLTLYQVVMPEVSYPSANIVNYSYQRTSTNGVGLLTVDIWLLEVRVTATAAFANTAAPSGADPVSDGSVQPQDPSTTRAAALQKIATENGLTVTSTPIFQ